VLTIGDNSNPNNPTDSTVSVRDVRNRIAIGHIYLHWTFGVGIVANERALVRASCLQGVCVDCLVVFDVLQYRLDFRPHHK
jgi:hypothetical protein